LTVDTPITLSPKNLLSKTISTSWHFRRRKWKALSVRLSLYLIVHGLSFDESLTQIPFHAASGIHVLENVKDIAPHMFPLCSGIILISSVEIGLFFSGQGGPGVAVKRVGDKWSAPVAVSLSGAGFGAVVGCADKDMLIVLNPLTMKRLLEGDGQLKVGVDMGFASGNIGHSAAVDIAMSNKGGLGSSFVYTFSKGALLSAEVQFCTISNADEVNKEFYGSSDVADIFNGKAKASDEALVSKLHAAIGTQ
jgi:lipid-binding SYLF domain-containing protein